MDWDFYVGPAPMRPYNPNCFYDYGYDWFKLSGAGHQVAWGVHHLDVVNWAMKVTAPVSVSATGGNYAFQDNREWPNTFSATAEYGPGPVARNGFILQYEMRLGCRRDRRSHGKCFYGTKASMLVDRGGYSIVAEGGAVETGLTRPTCIAPEQHTYAGGAEPLHCQDFLDCMRTRRTPAADVEQGHTSSNVGHLMNIAWLVGRRIRWDGDKEQVVDDPQANELVTKPYRAPWKLEV
jgi:predicted dehydrogenase